MSTELRDLISVINFSARGAERSQQVDIGPSEIGVACERRLAMGLIGAPKPNTNRDEWTSTVGTACHSWMEQAFSADNARRQREGLPARWLIEQTVEIRAGLKGHCDLYDLETHTVIDHKFPGVTSIRKYRKAKHPGKQYQWQAHLYGRGWANMGMPVQAVQLIMWPRSGLLTDAWTWGEDYDSSIADTALARVDGLLTGMNYAEHVGHLGDFFDALDRDTEHCNWCGYFDRTAVDATQGCAGPFYEDGYTPPVKGALAGILG